LLDWCGIRPWCTNCARPTTPNRFTRSWLCLRLRRH